MPKISIIIPVYNAEKYLRKCLDSILSQTFSDYEVILVDDGSKDSSAAICEEYSLKDERFTLIKKQPSGVSDTRNRALDVVKGEYLCFVDSDDTIEFNTLSVCMNTVIEKDVDCVCFGHRKLDEEENVLSERNYSDFKEKYGNDVFRYGNESERLDFLVKNIFNYKICWEACFRIYRNDIVQKNNIRFNKDNVYGEDLFFTAIYTLHSNSTAVVPYAFYNYYQHATSATGIRVEKSNLNEINTMSYYLYNEMQKRCSSFKELFPLIHYFLIVNQFQRFDFRKAAAYKDEIKLFDRSEHNYALLKLFKKDKIKFRKYIDRERLLLYDVAGDYICDLNYSKYYFRVALIKSKRKIKKSLNKIFKIRFKEEYYERAFR